MKTEEIYMIDDSGKLFRKGEEIGRLEDDTMTLKPEAKKYQAAVTRWLREKADEAEKVAAPVIPSEAQQDESRLAAVQRDVANGKALAKTQWDDDCAFAIRTGCPPPPKKNPQFGDKSPAFVEWLHKYRHEEFLKRYGVIRRGKVPVVATNPETGIDEVTGYRETYFATRKTHLTEVVSTNSNLGDDMDWNA